jgi:hypothetical protein
MTYERFEQLPVWQAGIGLGRQVYALTAKRAFRHQRSLRDQFERAAVSASNNIAEGFERGTTQELLTFLYIARLGWRSAIDAVLTRDPAGLRELQF